MDVFANLLGKIDGGRVLDVGTQEGHFVRILKENLNAYSEIVGIDIDKTAIQTARNTLEDGDLRFCVMDAERLHQLGAQREPILVVVARKP